MGAWGIRGRYLVFHIQRLWMNWGRVLASPINKIYSHGFLQLLMLLMTFFQSFLKFGFRELALSWSISLLPRFCFLSVYTFTPRFYTWSYKFYHFCKYLVIILGISENIVISSANDDIFLSPLRNCISLCCPLSLP